MVSLHINAKKKDFSNKVIISGDPLRVKYIAKNFLQSSCKINSIRLMLGYTGYYKDKKISVMSHGMGMPSLSIYIHELVNEYSVRKIIRLGTCGGIGKLVKIKDVIIAMGASTDSSINKLRFNNYNFTAISDFKMLYNAYQISKKNHFNVHIGNIFSTDIFYGQDENFFNLLKKFKILGIDMETAALYSLSAELNFKAISICTVSDCIFTKEKMSFKDRERTLYNATKLSLELLLR
ncbi:purine-nucleoside phosphorylase [Buchnera aphidicola]|uniref:purine-nucleoside phosphorylase n=1 Tax=Buchnera aphidicola TaxID=9 RepID=UPI0034642BF8